MNGTGPSPGPPAADLPRETSHDRPPAPKTGGSSSAAQNRRAKNAAHRADDVGEFRRCSLSILLLAILGSGKSLGTLARPSWRTWVLRRPFQGLSA